MTKEAKKNYVKEMKKNFTENESVMIAQYQGLNVNELDALRKELRDKGILFKITKKPVSFELGFFLYNYFICNYSKSINFDNNFIYEAW